MSNVDPLFITEKEVVGSRCWIYRLYLSDLNHLDAKKPIGGIFLMNECIAEQR